MADESQTYLDKLKLWAMYAGAVVIVLVLQVLLSRWLGKEPAIPAPPPPVIVVSPDGTPITVHIINAPKE